MNFFKTAINVFIGIGVMILGMFSVVSLISILDHEVIGADEILTNNLYLFASLCFAYFLNKPRKTPEIRSFYNTKWIFSSVVIFALVVAGLVSYLSETKGILALPLLPSKGEFISLGGVLLLVSCALCLLVLAYILWRCPKCKYRLPFLKEGKSAKVGFSISCCPNCKVVLKNA